MQPAHAKIILQTAKRTINKEGHRVDLRVTFNRQNREFATSYRMEPETFEKVFGAAPRGRYKQLRLELDAIQSRAQDIINDLGEDFTFESFRDQFQGRKESRSSVWGLFQEVINDVEQEGRWKTASSYRCAMNAYQFYRPNLTWRDITPKFLKNFENHMLKPHKGRRGGKYHRPIEMLPPASITTVGIYASAMRAVCNVAVDRGYMKRDAYPFGKRKYQRPNPKNVKKALTLEQVRQIRNYETENLAEAEARDFWLLSYFCNGMNIADLALLKWENVGENHLWFRRSKTGHKDLKPVKVPLIDQSREIINRYGKPEAELVFDITTPEAINKIDNGRQLKMDVQQKVKLINKYMARIGEKLELGKITTYTARHSFATVMKRSGAPLEKISEAMGHADLKTTENYLDSFEDDQMLELQRNLL